MDMVLAHDEVEAWHKLCEKLKATGVVTDADLQSPAGTLETPGQQVFAAIKDWGEMLVRLRTTIRE
jgi:hypothetical protein